MSEMNQDRMKELIDGVDERVNGYIRRWMTDPRVREVLHRPLGKQKKIIKGEKPVDMIERLV